MTFSEQNTNAARGCSQRFLTFFFFPTRAAHSPKKVLFTRKKGLCSTLCEGRAGVFDVLSVTSAALGKMGVEGAFPFLSALLPLLPPVGRAFGLFIYLSDHEDSPCVCTVKVCMWLVFSVWRSRAVFSYVGFHG